MTDRDPDIAARLRHLAVPEHRDSFWNSLDVRLAATEQTAIRSVSVFDDEGDAEDDLTLDGHADDHLGIVGADRAGPRTGSTLGRGADRGAPSASVFSGGDAAVAPRRARRFERVLAAAAAVVVVAAAVIALRASSGGGTSTAEPSTTTTTVPGPAPPPPTPVPNSSPRSVPADSKIALRAEPIGVSPDGKYLYVSARAEGRSGSPCGPGAVALFAQPLSGGDAFAVLADRTFRSPRLEAGPDGRVLIVDGCDGASIVRPSSNGVLLESARISIAGSLVENAAWERTGTSVYVRDPSRGWLNYDLISRETRPASIARDVVEVVELADGRRVVARIEGASAVYMLDDAVVRRTIGEGTTLRDYVQLSPDRKRVAILGDGAAYASFGANAARSFVGAFTAAAWSPDSAALFVSSASGELTQLTLAGDAGPGRSLGVAPSALFGTAGEGSLVAVSGTRTAAGDFSGVATVVPLESK